MTPAQGIHLYVLAGGQSRRFGSDKAMADVTGTPLICGVIEALAGLSKVQETISLVTGVTERYTELGYRVITDQPSGVGPLGGLCAALEDKLNSTGSGWVLLVSCDLILPKREWVDALIEHTDTGEVLAVAYHGTRWEPMLALYHTDLLPIAQTQLNNGNRSFQQLLNNAPALRVHLPDGMTSIPQANTPQQLQEALRDRGAA